MSAPFVHLNVHSNFSFLRGTATVESLVSAAAAMGMKALALTDTNGLYAAVPFEKACREAGIMPVYGAELDGKWGGNGSGPATARAVLLARNREGFAEVCRIVTSRMLDEDFSLRAALEKASENIYIISSDPRIVEALHLRANLCVALPTAEGGEARTERWRLRELSRRLGVRTVACGRVCMAAPGEHLVHRVLTAIRTRTTLGTIPAGEAEPRSAYLRTPAEVARVFADDPESVAETARIADDCSVDLELGRRRLPRFTPPPGETASSMLEKVAMKGLAERLEVGAAGAAVDTGASAAQELAAAEKTLRYEISVINGKGLADYFLICWDIVRFARGRGMRSVGRGSAGNSIVSYALGITHVNPIRHNMFFERFLNPEREQLPDFDIDFGTEDREEVLKYIFRRYGKDRVAMIGTFSTMRARSALRETAKAMGIPEGEIAPLIKRIPFYASIDRLEEIRRVSPAAAGIPLESEPFRTVVSLARRIGGFPRHMATHPCGLVISPGPVTDLVPLQRGDKGYEITQWSMYDVEAAGLVKIDIIGQKGLAVIQETAAMAAANEGRPMHPDRIDYLGDPLAGRMLREGRTEGCFYIESPIMMQLMKQAGCDDFEVLTALSSIIRPGVSNHGGKQSYLRRRLGLEPVPALHPAVADVLSGTFGCLIYQEQVIKLAVAVAGMSYAEADGLRRCMSFKNRGEERMSAYRDSFLRGARARGVPPAVASEVFERIAAFAGYAFCKAHSASFAVESFESAWWKAHYPAEFMAAVISNGGGYYSHEEYLEEAKRLGLAILPPCVNESGVRHHGRGSVLRVGLAQVKGLASETAEGIVAGRAGGAYRSLEDFAGRVNASAAVVESLIRCGAMDSFGRTRPRLMWELKLLQAGGRLSGDGSTASAPEGRGAAVPPRAAPDAGALIARLPDLEEYGPVERLLAEREILDMCISGHPLDIYSNEIAALAARRELIRSDALERNVGREIEIVGWKVTYKATRIESSGEEMIFITFSDHAGRFETVFFPEAWRRNAAELVRGRGPFHIRGRVESELGVVSVVGREAVLLRKLE